MWYKSNNEIQSLTLLISRKNVLYQSSVKDECFPIPKYLLSGLKFVCKDVCVSKEKLDSLLLLLCFKNLDCPFYIPARVFCSRRKQAYKYAYEYQNFHKDMIRQFGQTLFKAISVIVNVK